MQDPTTTSTKPTLLKSIQIHFQKLVKGVYMASLEKRLKTLEEKVKKYKHIVNSEFTIYGTNRKPKIVKITTASHNKITQNDIYREAIDEGIKRYGNNYKLEEYVSDSYEHFTESDFYWKIVNIFVKGEKLLIMQDKAKSYEPLFIKIKGSK